LAKGSVKEAVAEFEASLAIDGSRALTHYNLANALLRLSRSEEAVSHYRESYRLRPDFAPARQMLERLGVQP
jgi:tetratricopeptide (TPR) repeat protein